MTNCGAVANAAVLKKCAGVLWLGGRFGFPTIFGRCSANPANALLFVACVTVTGIPDCSEKIAFSDHPPNTALPTPVDANRCPRPAGRSYIPLNEVTFGISPLDESRSR